MAEGATAGATPLLPGLPDEIVVWEILLRLSPQCVLRCSAVCRSWRRVTSTDDFLSAHHGRQPSLPVVCGFSGSYQSILTFDHQAADPHLQPVARLDDLEGLYPETSCDGLLILSVASEDGDCVSVCNPTTRQHAPLWEPPDFMQFPFLGMYPHHPTGEYRVLMHRSSNDEDDEEEPIAGDLLPNGRVGFYVFTLGSDQPRYIGGAAAHLISGTPALFRESLHWSPSHHQGQSILLWVFDTTTESFREMRAPRIPTKSYIFEMDGTLGIYSHDNAMQTVDIWALQNYEGEVWEKKYRVELPIAEINGQIGGEDDELDVSVVSADGDVLLLLGYGRWLFYVDTGGKLVDSFLHDGQQVYACQFRLKQTLVRHNFFTALEGYAVNASPPFI
jgi:F-box interacting protein